MKIIYIFLIFIISADISFSSESLAYNYTEYPHKYLNKSINSSIIGIQQHEDDSSALLYVKYLENYYNHFSYDFTVKDITILKEGKSTNLENSLSYCINSAVLDSGLSISLNNVQVFTSDEGAIGVCTTNDGSMNIQNSTISTQKKNSIAVHTIGDSGINGKDSIISTSGENSPAISTQKGSSISFNKCQLHTSKTGSPLFQILGYMYLKDSYGWAENSHAIIADGAINIEIINSILNCSWKGNGDDASGILLKNTSFNPDEENDNPLSFFLKNSSLEINSETAPMFLVDKAYISFDLQNSKIKSKIFLKFKNTSFKAHINLINCDIEGDIITDEKAYLTIDLSRTNFKGAINPGDKAGEIIIYMDKNSNITLTGNSNCDYLNNMDLTNSNVNKNSFSFAGLEEDSSSNILISKIMLLLFAYLLI